MQANSLALFGTFELQQTNHHKVGFESDKARALLAYLVVESHQPHRREKLAGLLWPEKSEARARRNLSQALYNVRQVLGPSADTMFEVTAKTIQLNPVDQLFVDALAFEALWHSIQEHQHSALAACPDCLISISKAVDLYRGAFLSGFGLDDNDTFEEWHLLMRESYQRRMIDMLYSIAQSHIAQGKHATALEYLYDLLAIEPTQEEAHRQSMRVLNVLGRRDEALTQYEKCRRILWEELRVEPEESTTRLFRRLKGHEHIDLRLDSDPSQHTAQLLETLARVAFRRGEHSEASDLFSQCLRLYEKKGDLRGQARMLSELGMVARAIGDFKHARALVEKAQQIYESQRDAASRAKANISLGRLLVYEGEFVQSNEHIDTALSIYEDIRWAKDQAYLLALKALNWIFLAEYDKALGAARAALKGSEDQPNQITVNFAMSMLALATLGKGQLEEAEPLLTQAATLSKSVKRFEELVGAQACLAYLHIQAGNIDQARKHIQDALILCEETRAIVPVLFTAPAVALFLRVQGQTETANAIFGQCQRYVFFQRAELFQSLYKAYLPPVREEAEDQTDIGTLLAMLPEAAAFSKAAK